MSGRQSTLRELTDSPDDPVGGLRSYLNGLYGRVRSRLGDLGLSLDWWGESPFDISTDRPIYVYQYVTAYTKSELGERYGFGKGRGDRSAREGSAAPEVQFKTGIYVLGQPTDGLERRIRDIDNPRLVTLFNTREYATYMEGFGFSEKNTYVQREEVSAREVQNKGYGLGVPWFEVEAYDEEGSLQGYADGFFNPFKTETTTIDYERGEEPPQHEVWKVGSRQYHDSGDRYQIAPPAKTGAKERAKNASGKVAYINGLPVGKVLGGGRIRLKVAYKNPARATYNDRATLLEQTGTPYQALSQGANIYKVQETDDRIVFSTKPPRDFDAPDAKDISPDAVGVEKTSEQVTQIIIDDDEPTQFTVETDEEEGRLLGLYDPPVVRNIDRGTELV